MRLHGSGAGRATRSLTCFFRRACSSSSAGGSNGGSGGGRWSSSSIAFGHGLIGDLADASILARQGETVVHAVVTSAPNPAATDDMLPLTVDFRSRFYASGVLPDSRDRRERHGSDEEILAARVIDRAIRPLFPKGLVDTLQLVVTSHAADGYHDPVVLGVNAASAALSTSSQPWSGPIGCVRVGIVGGELVINPSVSELESSSLDMLYAGTHFIPVHSIHSGSTSQLSD